jgi:hypothetical protein
VEDLTKLLKEKGQDVDIDSFDAIDVVKEDDEDSSLDGDMEEGSEDFITRDRRQQVKDAMLHAWSSYEKYAWGFDELMVLFFFLPLLYLSVRFSKYTPCSLILGILSLLCGKDSGNLPSLLANCGNLCFLSLNQNEVTINLADLVQPS